MLAHHRLTSEHVSIHNRSRHFFIWKKYEQPWPADVSKRTSDRHAYVSLFCFFPQVGDNKGCSRHSSNIPKTLVDWNINLRQSYLARFSLQIFLFVCFSIRSYQLSLRYIIFTCHPIHLWTLDYQNLIFLFFYFVYFVVFLVQRLPFFQLCEGIKSRVLEASRRASISRTTRLEPLNQEFSTIFRNWSTWIYQ